MGKAKEAPAASPGIISAFRLDIDTVPSSPPETQNIGPSSSSPPETQNVQMVDMSSRPNSSSVIVNIAEQELLQPTICSVTIYDDQSQSDERLTLVVKEKKISKKETIQCNLFFAISYLKKNAINKMTFECSPATISSFRQHLSKEVFNGTKEMFIQCVYPRVEVVRDDVEDVKTIAILFLSSEEHLENLTITDKKITSIPKWVTWRSDGSAPQTKTFVCTCKYLNCDIQEVVKYMKDLPFTRKAELSVPIRLRPDVLAVSRFMDNSSSPYCSKGINVSYSGTDFRVHFLTSDKLFILYLALACVSVPILFIFFVVKFFLG